MAADYANEIQRIQPAGPYHLLGWSLGGILAHTVATELQSRGEEVAILAMFDCYPSDPSLHGPVEYRKVIDVVLGDFGYDPAILDDAGVEDAEVLAAVRRSGGALVDWDDRAIIKLLRVAENNLALFRGFTPRRFRGDVLFLTATVTRPEIRQTVDTWLPYVDGRIDNHEIECRHELMMRPAHVAEVGQVLGVHLDGCGAALPCSGPADPLEEAVSAGGDGAGDCPRG
jgi:thioesterase domain-containing protein